MSNEVRPNWDLGNEAYVAIALFGAAAVAALIYMVYVARKDRVIYPFFLFAGAGLTVVYEPLNNVLGLCTYPEIDQITYLSLMDRDMPVYLGFVYFFYFSATVMWLKRRFDAGIDVTQWWKYYAAFTAFVTAFEPVFIWRDWWNYYGDQGSLMLFDFPMWWWIANGYCLFGAATVFHLLGRHGVLTERKAWMYVPLFPMSVVAFHLTAALPIYFALQSNASHGVITLASMGTMALALFNMYLLSQIVPRKRTAAVVKEPAPAVPGKVPVSGS